MSSQGIILSCIYESQPFYSRRFSCSVEHCQESSFKVHFRRREMLINLHYHSNRVLLLLHTVILSITHAKELH